MCLFFAPGLARQLQQPDRVPTLQFGSLLVRWHIPLDPSFNSTAGSTDCARQIDVAGDVGILVFSGMQTRWLLASGGRSLKPWLLVFVPALMALQVCDPNGKRRIVGNHNPCLVWLARRFQLSRAPRAARFALRHRQINRAKKMQKNWKRRAHQQPCNRGSGPFCVWHAGRPAAGIGHANVWEPAQHFELKPDSRPVLSRVEVTERGDTGTKPKTTLPITAGRPPPGTVLRRATGIDRRQ